MYQKNMHQNSDSPASVPQNENQTQTAADTTHNQVIQQPDTVQTKKPESSIPIATAPKTETQPIKPAGAKSDTALFRVVIFETNEKDKAVSHFAELHLEKAKLYTKDSTNFKIFFYKHAATRDTTELKNQFSEAFSFPVRMERIVH